MIDLHDKTIVVTGASSGIGRQCALTCARLGARVVLFGRDEVRLAETLEQCGLSSRHLVHSVDLCNHDDVERAILASAEQIGVVQGIVHAAGISTTRPLATLSADECDRFFRTNVTAPVHLTKILTKRRHFDENGGSIVFISSVMGVVGERGKTIYAMTKGALISGARCIALELASRKIRVNVVSPGVVVTPLSDRAAYSQSESSRERIQALHPLGLGTVDDVANACVFLLSDAAVWITGMNMIVDGGYSAH